MLTTFTKLSYRPPTSLHDLISCQKGLGLAYRKSECLGIAQIVQPEALIFWEGSRMAPYHKKFTANYQLRIFLKSYSSGLGRYAFAAS